jgi:hypothetical protein
VAPDKGEARLVKRFKISLSIGVCNFVHATRCTEEGQWTRFYRDDAVIAEYATVSVKKVEVVRRLDDPPSTRGGRFRARP